MTSDNFLSTDGRPPAFRQSRDGVDKVIDEWHAERADIDVTSMGIVSRIWRIARHLERQREKNLAEWSTDRGTVDILSMLRRSGPPYRRTAGDLTKHSLITSGGVSQRLEKLERGELITRHVDVNDRRRVEVQLTAKGTALIDSVFGDVMDRDTATLAHALSPTDREMLVILLRKLLLSLEPSEAVDEI
ncbi:MarR family winged helix-turn-helix transcriptional regulator [Rhodococcus baikonurensis]|uniref:MarR family winged helix-turn-helix transcriptional regulator n=1 Tax=Rhodococcus erythropolis group TaxID=2840174 RepID=UPI000BB36F36|nr:MarR family transcriptional regulator [Rhodococcus erythropolis]PBI88030.1 transcriptional regulator SlyA [Rhodococcus erythropolis]